MNNALAAKEVALSNNLRLFFKKGQGVRVGESAVVSRCLHQPHPPDPRKIRVLIDQDAGKAFGRFSDPGQAVHIDVYHDPTVLKLVPIARRVWNAIDDFWERQAAELTIRKAEDRLYEPSEVTKRVFLATAENQGYLYPLMSKGFDLPTDIPENLHDHVHVLIELSEEWYALILCIIDAVETAILQQGYNIRRVAEVLNRYGKTKQRELDRLVIPFFGKRRPGDEIVYLQNQNQLILEMARRLGSIEDAVEFLDTMHGNFLQRLAPRSVKKRHQDLDELAEQMANLGLARKGLLGYSLTEEGQELREHLQVNRRELEAELRKILRRLPGKNRRYQRTDSTQMKCREQDVLNRHKILVRDDQNASMTIAVPETIIQGAVRSRLDGLKRLRITPEDIRVYGKKSFVPMDVCLAVDCSASMAGEKSRAAWQLAEHLLYVLREKVSVVAFQEMEARVVVPFTHNHRRLMAGLRTVIPEGMTPLASGLMKSLELIKESRVRNPLLILITDGMPTYPLWSFDSQADALKAAEEIAKSNVRLACIGVRSNRDFLEKLAKTAHGTLYVVDNLDRDTLVQVVHEERDMLRHAL
ncbi:MAG: VWA domain-containing protein [Syntrophomonadaceae bacterium]|nr:VWA domain-containing protein [Syntrophomonadaceae bacterium]